MPPRHRPLSPDGLALEREVELINRFPDKNPHPVMPLPTWFLLGPRATATAASGMQGSHPTLNDRP